MYLVTIKTEGKEFIINEISTRTKNRIEGTIKQGINSIDSFEFTIYPDNIGHYLNLHLAMHFPSDYHTLSHYYKLLTASYTY